MRMAALGSLEPDGVYARFAQVSRRNKFLLVDAFKQIKPIQLSSFDRRLHALNSLSPSQASTYVFGSRASI
jgi:hypothetical protein